MNIVFDTNALISATLWDNSVCHKLLIELINREVELSTSIRILDEYKNVIMRDFKYKREEVDEIIIKLLSIFKIVKSIIKINIIKEDPEDNKILECAVSSNSQFILSYDNHLLKLREYKGIKILTPVEFIKRLE